jgi:signal transduction histidine kinase/ActR/RegA family two-component response regulator
MIVIILSNLLIVVFSVSVGILFLRDNINKSQEMDLLMAANIADHYISSEIEVIKLKAAGIAKILIASEEEKWSDVLKDQETNYPEFIGMVVFEAGLGIIASAGEMPALPEIAEDQYIKQAFLGERVISSTIPSSRGVMFYTAVPISEINNRIVILTIPGMYLTEKLSTIVIWETGHIFVDDAEGHIIANVRQEWVQDRVNYLHTAHIDDQHAIRADIVRRGINGETGVGYFTVSGVPRICAFTPIKSSMEGWFLGIIAPLPDSPFRDIDSGMLVVGLVAIVLSILFAMIASVFVKKPYEEIAALKEAAETSSMYKSTFLANMSHEMRTPLNVVVGLTDLQMEDNNLPGNVLNDLKKINNAGALLLSIVNDVLDISKIEAGKLELTLEKYDIASLLNDIITLNMIRIESKPIKFKIEIDEELPKELFGDELRVKQIFNNLLSNAFKYTKQGAVTLRIECRKINEENIMIYIAISDTGIGIRPEDMKKLFSEYNQVDSRANRKIEGTGLGLSIAKKLVELMDGEISVESVYGSGSTFFISVMQGVVSNETIGIDVINNLKNFKYTDQKHRITTELIRPDLSYAKVLVVDDMQTNLDVAAGLMGKYKMQVDCVTSGQAAIDRVKSGDPVYDAIFMDHMMPEMDGIETTQIIRSLDSEYAKTVPIISLTANALVGNEQMFLEKGFNAFLSKPIDILKLDATIKRWVRKKIQYNNHQN